MKSDAAAVMSLVSSRLSEETDDERDGVLLAILNATPFTLHLFWMAHDASRRFYASLHPYTRHTQHTYPRHRWILAATNHATAPPAHAAPLCAMDCRRQQVVVTPRDDATDHLVAMDGPHPWRGLAAPAPSLAGRCERLDPFYTRVRISSTQLIICSSHDVDPRALERADMLLAALLAHVPASILARLRHYDARFVVLAVGTPTTAIPEHRHLAHTQTHDKRDITTATRGLGGTRRSPVTSFGEENILHLAGDAYARESIAVHEMAHAVMNIGFGPTHRRALDDAYAHARQHRLYRPTAYVASCAAEYWAELSQAWFAATRRHDVTDGMASRDDVRRRDPRAAALLARVWGDGAWRYPWPPR